MMLAELVPEAQTILDVVMYAQLRGNNQGVVKLIGDGVMYVAEDPGAGRRRAGSNGRSVRRRRGSSHRAPRRTRR